MQLRFFVFMILISSSLLAGDSFTHAATGIRLPAELAGLKQGAASTYKTEDGEEGVAVPFHSETAEATIFIRGFPKNRIPTAKDALEESLSAIKELEKNGTYSDLKVFAAKPDPSFPKWEKAAFMAKQENGALVVSYIFISMVKQHSVKIRLTTNDPKNPNGPKFIEHIQAMIDALSAK